MNDARFKREPGRKGGVQRDGFLKEDVEDFCIVECKMCLNDNRERSKPRQSYDRR